MEVKIGVQFSSRELVLDTGADSAEVAAALSAALAEDNGLFSLSDSKGRRVMVPASKLAYVEITESEQRRVGFGTI